MSLCMSGLDYRKADICLRERLSFSKSAVTELDGAIAALPGVRGAVLLSTCNRTELYLDCEETLNPGALLCQAAGVGFADFAEAFLTRRGEDCLQHLLEVACGLQSQILGEDQILTQVKTAAALAREAGSATAELETLFRTASACGKAAKSQVRLTKLPTSAAHQAVHLVEEHLGSLSGKRALVIGNGEMGKLSASLLRSAGCDVSVTLRTYRHGETVIPAGCRAVPYEERYAAMEDADILFSSTTSPHYTVTEEPFREVSRPPVALVDLAIPRDIQPEVGDIPGVTLWNMDSLGQALPAGGEELEQVRQLLETHLERFRQWRAYRASIPAQESVKQAAWERVRHYLEGEMDSQEAARMAVEKTVELLAGGLKEHLSPEDWLACGEKIRAHTR